MKKHIPLKDYVRLLRSYSNIPLTLNRITLPFGVITDSTESKTILLGHVLDDLVSRFPSESKIDVIDVVTCAHGLGHEVAEVFLDHAAQMINEMMRDQGLYGTH